jgi:cephalosporin hydroxylase
MSDTDPKDPQRITAMAADESLADLSLEFLVQSARHRYCYNFSWLGLPVIQYPTDLIAMQEIIWRVKPALIVETGIAHGGSLIFYASMLALLGSGTVVGIDVDIRAHNRRLIEQHPLASRVTMIEGSSIAPEVAARVTRIASEAGGSALVVLDSNHTHEHVLEELRLYSHLVSKGSYLVVFDTVVEDMPADFFPDRPWGRGNNPMTAVLEFLQENDRFEVDVELERKLLITVAPSGYLRCTKDPT